MTETNTDQGDIGVLSQRQLIILRFKKHKLAVVGMYVLIVLYLTALFAPFVAPYGQSFRDMEYGNCPPMPLKFSVEHGFHTPRLIQRTDPVTLHRYYEKDPDTIVPLGFFVKGPSYKLFGMLSSDRHLFGVAENRLDAAWEQSETEPRFFFFGTDKFGHGIFSRIIHGSRVSLSIGLVAVVITFVLGASIGGISGYMGGAVDNLIQRLIEIINSFPRLPLWLALGAVVPADWSALQTYFAITVMLSMLNWTRLARVVRGKILSLREEDYAMAARLLGASHGRVLFRHLLPGFTSHIIVTLTLSIPAMILGETALSFLGLGLRPPVVSWGVMLQDCLNLQVVANYPWLGLPIFMIMLTVLSFNFMGDGLRDAADPYS